MSLLYFLQFRKDSFMYNSLRIFKTKNKIKYFLLNMQKIFYYLFNKEKAKAIDTKIKCQYLCDIIDERMYYL